MAESDKPKNSLIMGMVVATIAMLIVVVLGIVQYFDMTVREEVAEKVDSHVSNALVDLQTPRSRSSAHYQWVSQKDGVVRIPAVDEAARLTLNDWSQRPDGLSDVTIEMAMSTGRARARPGSRRARVVAGCRRPRPRLRPRALRPARPRPPARPRRRPRP